MRAFHFNFHIFNGHHFLPVKTSDCSGCFQYGYPTKGTSWTDSLTYDVDSGLLHAIKAGAQYTSTTCFAVRLPLISGYRILCTALFRGNSRGDESWRIVRLHVRRTRLEIRRCLRKRDRTTGKSFSKGSTGFRHPLRGRAMSRFAYASTIVYPVFNVFCEFFPVTRPHQASLCSGMSFSD